MNATATKSKKSSTKKKAARKAKPVTLEQALENSRKALYPALGSVYQSSVALWKSIDGANQKEVSDKAKRAGEIIDDLDICEESKRGVRGLIGLLLDEELPASDGQGFLRVGMIVVPLADHEGHNYPLGKPAMILQVDEDDGDAKGLRVTDGTGNRLKSSMPRAAVRHATREEALSFLAALPTNILTAIAYGNYSEAFDMAD